LWEGKKELKDNSGSGKDLALAYALVSRGYTNEEID